MKEKEIPQLIAKIENDFPKEIVLFGINGSYYRIIKTVSAVLKYKQGGLLLDIGTGFGIIPRILQKRNFQVTVLDCWSDEETKKRFERFSFDQVICDASFEPFPLKSNMFDVVLLSEVIEHIYVSPKHMLGEIYRVLKPEGILIITTPNFVNLRKRIWMLFGKSPRDRIKNIYECHPYERHSHEYTMDELLSVVSWSGFKLIDNKFENLLSFPTLMKGVEVEVYSGSPARKNNEFPVYDRHFRLNKPIQWLKLVYIFITQCIPSFRDSIFVIAKKPE